MTTKLEKELRREILIDGEPYTIAISPQSLKLTPKGRRKGQELIWKELIKGQPEFEPSPTASLERAQH